MGTEQSKSFNDIANEIIKNNLYWLWDVIARAIAEVLICEDVPEGTPAGYIAKRLKAATKTSATQDLVVSDITDLSVTAQEINDAVSSMSASSEITLEGERGFNSDWELKITGEGTSASPFLIYTPYDFCQIGRNNTYPLSACYRLMNNLDFSSAVGMTADEAGNITVIDTEAPLYNSGKGYVPIGYTDSTDSSTRTSFSGSLDGNEKIIKGIVTSGFAYSGIFSATTSSFSCQNLTIKDSCFIPKSSGNVYAGALAGNIAGSIYGITSYATIFFSTTSTVYIGGLAGSISAASTTIKRCAVYGKIINATPSSSHYVGGFVGNNRYALCSILDSIATSDLQGHYAAGIYYASSSGASGTLKNCVYAGIAKPYNTSSTVYGIINATSSTTLENCYYNSASVVSESGESYGNAITVDRMKEDSFIDLLNTDASDPAFVFNELGIADGFPLTNPAFYTAEDIANLPIALVDVGKKTIRSSKYNFRNLLNLATIALVKELLGEYAKTTDVTQKLTGVPYITMINLDTDSWTLNDEGFYEQSVAVENLTTDSFIFTAQGMREIDFSKVSLAVTAENQLTFKMTEADAQVGFPTKFPVIIV